MERMVSGFKYRPRTRILTDNELVRVWNAGGDDTFGTIVKLLILTGQRVGEIMKLSRDMVGKVMKSDFLAQVFMRQNAINCYNLLL
ncbi:MAG: hypothetical protein JSR81_12540 [Proteobacteria bacterium]|nr:hypothetical protein [Pseudomonadota bacterium]